MSGVHQHEWEIVLAYDVLPSVKVKVFEYPLLGGRL